MLNDSDHLANKGSQLVKWQGVRPVSFGEFPIKFTALLALQWSHSPQNWSKVKQDHYSHSSGISNTDTHSMWDTGHSRLGPIPLPLRWGCLWNSSHHRWPWNTDTLQVYGVHWAFIRVQRSKNPLQEGRDNSPYPTQHQPSTCWRATEAPGVWSRCDSEYLSHLFERQTVFYMGIVTLLHQQVKLNSAAMPNGYIIYKDSREEV